ncbi:MAG: phosphoglycerate dehydrogenase, partial [bacterium]
MKKKILICDSIASSGLKMLKKNFSVSVQPGLSEADIVKVIPDFHALIVRSQTKVTARVIKAAKSLKIIARAGIGVDNIDVGAATAAGIVVVNAPRANTLAA